MIGSLLKSLVVDWWEDNAARLGAALAYYIINAIPESSHCSPTEQSGTIPKVRNLAERIASYGSKICLSGRQELAPGRG